MAGNLFILGTLGDQAVHVCAENYFFPTSVNGDNMTRTYECIRNENLTSWYIVDPSNTAGTIPGYLSPNYEDCMPCEGEKWKNKVTLLFSLLRSVDTIQ